MTKTLRKGAAVSWKSHDGETHEAQKTRETAVQTEIQGRRSDAGMARADRKAKALD